MIAKFRPRTSRALWSVWEAHLICSGRDCYAELEVAIDSLDELDGLSCDCGHGFVLLAISELTLH